MPLVSRLILISIVCLAFGGIAVAQPRVPGEVQREMTRTGSASVIVGVRAAIEPEGRLSNQQIALQHAAIRSALDTVLASIGSAIELRHRYRTIPFFAARVDADGLAALTRMPEVLTVEADIPEPPALAQSVPLINATIAHAKGATGAGWKVAVLDTGVQTDHPFLADKTVAEACYSNGGGGGTSVCPGGVNSTSAGSAVPCALGGCDHGTHVAGIAVGSGATFTGVAPGAQLVAIQVFTNIGGSPSSYPSDQVLAMERVLALAGPENGNRIAAVNLSLGGSRFFDQASCDAASPSRKAVIENLRSLGIATTIASGNNGYTDSMQLPACLSPAVSVGSTTKADAVSSFTNRAPFLALLAPGSSINSSVWFSGFGVKSGTSMATPHVAGAWAVLKQASPASGVTAILQALRSSGVPVTDPESAAEAPQAIYPRIDVEAARVVLRRPGQPTVTSVIERANMLTVSWNSGGGTATHHRLDVYAGPTLIAQFTVGAVTSADIPIPAGTIGSFAVQVTAFNDDESSPPSALFPFTIGIGAPGLPTITAVGTVGPGQVLVVAWTPGAGASPTTYRLDFYAGPTLVTQVIVGPASWAYIPIPPGIAGTFSVRVTAFNGAIAGPTSAPENFTIGPVCDVPQAPVVSGGFAGSTAMVNWLPVAGATSYLVSAGTTPGGTQYFPETNVGLATEVGAGGLPPGFFAWVRVIAVNACGQQGPPTDFLVQ